MCSVLLRVLAPAFFMGYCFGELCHRRSPRILSLGANGKPIGRGMVPLDFLGGGENLREVTHYQ